MSFSAYSAAGETDRRHLRQQFGDDGIVVEKRGSSRPRLGSVTFIERAATSYAVNGLAKGQGFKGHQNRLGG
jgi:hypothetical protein